MLDASELFETLGGIEQEPDQDIVNRLRFDDALEIPIQLTDTEVWKNYVNNDLYEMDKKIREFFKKTRFRRESSGGYKTTASAMFLWIYGRNPTQKDSYACHVIHLLLRYYCTSYTGKSQLHGKKVPHVYKFSRYATRNKRPYSLRLRLEEAHDGNAVWRSNPSYDKRSKRGCKDRADGADADESSSDNLGGDQG